MFKTLWYMIKVFLVLGIATYLATLPGEVALEWQDYHVTVQMGFLAVALFVLLIVMVYASGLAYRIISLPTIFKRYSEQRRREKGYQALLRSLTAASMGDYKNARYLAVRAQKFLPEAESGLPLLLQAQSSRELDHGQNADEPYQLLLQNAETSLLGMQGLIQNAVMASDYEKALLLSREAFAKYPKNYQLLRMIYDLEVRVHLWSDALISLDKAIKHRVIELDHAKQDKVAIFCVLGDMAQDAGRRDEAESFYKKAVGLDQYFVPAVSRLARFYIFTQQRARAEKILLQALKKIDHPDLLVLWNDVMPEPKRNAVSVHFKWMSALEKYHKDSYPLTLAIARSAIRDALWGEAKSYLGYAEKLCSCEAVYNLWVVLEERTENRPDVIRQWMDRAAHASSGMGWVCKRTGRVYKEWQAVTQPEGFFNCLEWAPVENNQSPQLLSGH